MRYRLHSLEHLLLQRLALGAVLRHQLDEALRDHEADARAWSPAQAWQALAGREQTALQLYRDGGSRRVLLRRERFFALLR